MSQEREKKFIKVYIRLHNGNGCALRALPQTPLQQLVDFINFCGLQLPSNYSLVFGGRHLRCFSVSLFELGIVDNSILHVEESSFTGVRGISMDVCLCFQGELLVVRCCGDDSVAKLKQNIFKLTQIKPKDQVLVFNGRKLNGEQSLNHYKICPNSLIVLLSSVVPTPDTLSDYDHYNNFVTRDQLLSSVVSLCDKRTSITKNTLFRSDSLDNKLQEILPPIEIEIHQEKECESDSDNREFNFDAFRQSFGMNPLCLSLGQGLKSVKGREGGVRMGVDPQNQEIDFWEHIQEDIKS